MDEECIMKYNRFKYIYPPRPEHKIHPKSLCKFENGDFYFKGEDN